MVLFVGMTITISRTGLIEIAYENTQGSSEVDEKHVFPSYAYSFRISDSISTIHIEISSLHMENLTPSATPSIPTTVQSTVFLDTNRRRTTSSDENKNFHAAAMGQNIEQTPTSSNDYSTGGIVFSRLRLTHESISANDN